MISINPLVFFLFIFAVMCTADDSSFGRMLLIPSGDFEMGSTAGQRDERPVHRVHVDSFYISETEVTIWEYLQCVKDGACRMPFWWNRHYFTKKADDISGEVWLRLPVTGVSWDDARSYCKWKGPGYRLPTEAEWEYAARGKTDSEYFWGDKADSSGLYTSTGNMVSPVKSASPNRFGLYDMLGNVWEWCQDRYDAHYYEKSPAENPTGPLDTKKYPYRVIRGGSWNEYMWNIRCANRNYGESFRRFDGVGFRICKSAEVK